jgi:hypothetical protein
MQPANAQASTERLKRRDPAWGMKWTDMKNPLFLIVDRQKNPDSNGLQATLRHVKCPPNSTAQGRGSCGPICRRRRAIPIAKWRHVMPADATVRLPDDAGDAR